MIDQWTGTFGSQTHHPRHTLPTWTRCSLPQIRASREIWMRSSHLPGILIEVPSIVNPEPTFGPGQSPEEGRLLFQGSFCTAPPRGHSRKSSGSLVVQTRFQSQESRCSCVPVQERGFPAYPDQPKPCGATWDRVKSSLSGAPSQTESESLWAVPRNLFFPLNQSLLFIPVCQLQLTFNIILC